MQGRHGQSSWNTGRFSVVTLTATIQSPWWGILKYFSPLIHLLGVAFWHIKCLENKHELIFMIFYISPDFCPLISVGGMVGWECFKLPRQGAASTSDLCALPSSRTKSFVPRCITSSYSPACDNSQIFAAFLTCFFVFKRPIHGKGIFFSFRQLYSQKTFFRWGRIRGSITAAQL